eukprot:SAG11_NODE_4926_length_1720_cov_1.428748_1_plen_94_part_10
MGRYSSSEHRASVWLACSDFRKSLVNADSCTAVFVCVLVPIKNMAFTVLYNGPQCASADLLHGVFLPVVLICTCTRTIKLFPAGIFFQCKFHTV